MIHRKERDIRALAVVVLVGSHLHARSERHNYGNKRFFNSVTHRFKVTARDTIRRGSRRFRKSRPPQNTRCQKSDMMQFRS